MHFILEAENTLVVTMVIDQPTFERLSYDTRDISSYEK